MQLICATDVTQKNLGLLSFTSILQDFKKKKTVEEIMIAGTSGK